MILKFIALDRKIDGETDGFVQNILARKSSDQSIISKEFKP